MSTRKVAFITGASRGIGRACALALAQRGFDVVLTARTVTGKERLEHSSTIKKSLTDPLPGSLEKSAAEARAFGVDALVVKLDLSRREDWMTAVDAAVQRFGRLDVLVNNGRYIGPGHMDRFEDTPVELIEQMLTCNVVAPLHLIKLCTPIMKRQGGGIIINVTSTAGDRETPQPIGQGGWGLGYSITKAAFNRMVPGLAKELRQDNIAVIGLMPGFVGTERMAIELGEFGFDASKALPVENPGRVCAMLASASDPMHFSGRDIYGPQFYSDHEAVLWDYPPRAAN
ncbi:MAG TPA: SDR family oxidoreductase [Candidatus Acidoferrales bacterium]|nr:SDR family oxidoreductase [Candidatus Acidoferrales bacterium]